MFFITKAMTAKIIHTTSWKVITVSRGVFLSFFLVFFFSLGTYSGVLLFVLSFGLYSLDVTYCCEVINPSFSVIWIFSLLTGVSLFSKLYSILS